MLGACKRSRIAGARIETVARGSHLAVASEQRSGTEQYDRRFAQWPVTHGEMSDIDVYLALEIFAQLTSVSVEAVDITDGNLRQARHWADVIGASERLDVLVERLGDADEHLVVRNRVGHFGPVDLPANDGIFHGSQP